jgi:hypothetical protein
LLLFCVACSGYYTNAPIPQKIKTQGPQYEVHYRYIPPEDPALKECAQQCDSNRGICLESHDTNTCREEYHSCFRLCGGQVEQTRTCIKNCD